MRPAAANGPFSAIISAERLLWGLSVSFSARAKSLFRICALRATIAAVASSSLARLRSLAEKFSGGTDALLRIPLPRLQKEILTGAYRHRTRQGKNQVSEMRQLQTRAAVGRFLRHHFQEKLMV